MHVLLHVPACRCMRAHVCARIFVRNIVCASVRCIVPGGTVPAPAPNPPTLDPTHTPCNPPCLPVPPACTASWEWGPDVNAAILTFREGVKATQPSYRDMIDHWYSGESVVRLITCCLGGCWLGWLHPDLPGGRQGHAAELPRHDRPLVPG